MNEEVYEEEEEVRSLPELTQDFVEEIKSIVDSVELSLKSIDDEYNEVVKMLNKEDEVCKQTHERLTQQMQYIVKLAAFYRMSSGESHQIDW